jgi:hypothetical protein
MALIPWMRDHLARYGAARYLAFVSSARWTSSSVTARGKHSGIGAFRKIEVLGASARCASSRMAARALEMHGVLAKLLAKSLDVQVAHPHDCTSIQASTKLPMLSG